MINVICYSPTLAMMKSYIMGRGIHHLPLISHSTLLSLLQSIVYWVDIKKRTSLLYYAHIPLSLLLYSIALTSNQFVGFHRKTVVPWDTRSPWTNEPRRLTNLSMNYEPWPPTVFGARSIKAFLRIIIPGKRTQRSHFLFADFAQILSANALTDPRSIVKKKHKDLSALLLLPLSSLRPSYCFTQTA